MTTAQSGPQTIDTRIGTLKFTHDFANGLPTDATVQKLYDERDFQRACQAYLWALPAVSFTAWQRGIKEPNDVSGYIVRHSPTFNSSAHASLTKIQQARGRHSRS